MTLSTLVAVAMMAAFVLDVVNAGQAADAAEQLPAAGAKHPQPAVKVGDKFGPPWDLPADDSSDSDDDSDDDNADLDDDEQTVTTAPTDDDEVVIDDDDSNLPGPSIVSTLDSCDALFDCDKKYFIVVNATIGGTATTGLTWQQAAMACGQRSGRLAILRSEDDDSKVRFLAGQNIASNPTVDFAAWIGARQVAPDAGDFAWVDGTPLRRVGPWIPGSPDNAGGQESCVVYWQPMQDSQLVGMAGWTDNVCATTSLVTTGILDTGVLGTANTVPIAALCECPRVCLVPN